MSGLSLWSPHQHLRRAAASYLYDDGAGEEDDVGDLPSLSKHDTTNHHRSRGGGGGANSTSRTPPPSLPQWPSLLPDAVAAYSRPPPDLMLCCSGSSSSGGSATTTSPEHEDYTTSPSAASQPTRSSSGRNTLRTAGSSFSAAAGISVHPRRVNGISSRQSSASTNPFDCDDSPTSSSSTSLCRPDPELHGNLRLASHYQYGSNGELNEQVEAIALPTVSGRLSSASSSSGVSSYPSLLDDELDNDEAQDILATTPPQKKGTTTTTKPPLPTCLPHPRSKSPSPPASASKEEDGWTTPPRPQHRTTTTTTDTDSDTNTVPPDSPLSPKLLVQEDLQHMLAGKSAVEAFNFLQAMVIDLLNELEDIQSYHRDQMEDQMLYQAQQTRDYSQIASAIQNALQQRILETTSTKETEEKVEGNNGRDGEAAHATLLQRLQNDCEALQTQVSLLPPPPPTEDEHSPNRRSSAAGFFLRRTSPEKKKKPQDPGPAALQGFQCVVQHWTSHIDQLQQHNDQLSEQVKAQQEALDDLKALCDAKTFKIEALELQFANLNQSRSHLAQKLVDRTHQMLSLRRSNGSGSEETAEGSPGEKLGTVPRVVRVAAASSSSSSSPIHASPSSSSSCDLMVGRSPASQ